MSGFIADADARATSNYQAMEGMEEEEMEVEEGMEEGMEGMEEGMEGMEGEGMEAAMVDTEQNAL